MGAYEWLTVISQSTTLLDKHARSRVNIDMRAFYRIKEFLEEVLKADSLDTNESKVFNRCLESIQEDINLQDKFIHLFTEYDQKIDKIISQTIYFTKDDVDFVLKRLVELDYIQYTQLKSQYDIVTDFEYIKKKSITTLK